MIQVTIRATENYDFQGLYDLYRQEQVACQMLNLPNQPLHTWEKRLANIPSNVHSFVALLDTDDDCQIIGNAALTVANSPRRQHTGELVIAVKEEFWRMGVGNQLMQQVIDLVDNWLNLQRIELTVYTDNEHAMALYRKFGFNIEGEAKKFAFRNGEFVDAYYMARVKGSQ
ncbi:GNAT family N-acetyltransferase [Moraxella bovoculi]|uniref:GNAT family N-acetyltransferase n=1 Tax=Moraxella bovoculi TaxID=386891 RepID=UPI003F50367B